MHDLHWNLIPGASKALYKCIDTIQYNLQKLVLENIFLYIVTGASYEVGLNVRDEIENRLYTGGNRPWS